MKYKLNGEFRDASSAPFLLSSALAESDVANLELVTVQLNGEFVDKHQYSSTPIVENDEVDFLYFMGGGAL